MQTVNLTGKICVLTGSRVKIGFCCGLRLLRSGATLIATSRFVKDTARRYAAQPDFDQWKHRLTCYALDLRDLSAVVRFTEWLYENYTRIDALISNAAQTVRRPTASVECE